MSEGSADVVVPTEPEAVALELKRWGADFKDTEQPDKSQKKVTPRFPFRPELNSHLAFFRGGFTNIEADALVVPTSERLDLVGGPHEVLRKLGGEGYQAALTTMGHCRMSEVKLSKGFGIFAHNVVHTVGPRYNAKYTTAAVNALNKCYLNSLQACVDNGFRTAVFLPLHSDDKNYPVKAGAAIACRTLRRFLEHHPDKLDCIVLCLENDTYYDAYQEIMPQYMPRSEAEAIIGEGKLPADVGNEWGEDAVKERSIRISALPGMDADEFDAEVEEEDEAPMVVSEETTRLELAQKKASPDVRVLAAASDPTSADYVPQIYLQFLEQASSEDISALEAAKFLYVCGCDQEGRKLVVFNGGALAQMNGPRALVLPYIAKQLDTVSHSQFTIVYFHSPLANNAESISWIHDMAAMFPRRYFVNMRMAVVYATFWLKMHLRINRLADLWDIQDVSFYDDIRELFTSIPGVDTITIPSSILRADQSIIINRVGESASAVPSFTEGL